MAQRGSPDVVLPFSSNPHMTPVRHRTSATVEMSNQAVDIGVEFLGQSSHSPQAVSETEGLSVIHALRSDIRKIPEPQIHSVKRAFGQSDNFFNVESEGFQFSKTSYKAHFKNLKQDRSIRNSNTTFTRKEKPQDHRSSRTNVV